LLLKSYKQGKETHSRRISAKGIIIVYRNKQLIHKVCVYTPDVYHKIEYEKI